MLCETIREFDKQNGGFSTSLIILVRNVKNGVEFKVGNQHKQRQHASLKE